MNATLLNILRRVLSITVVLLCRWISLYSCT